MITLNGANSKVQDLLKKTSPPAQVRFVDNPNRPGWGWIYWGDVRIKPIQKSLCDVL